MSIAQQLLGLRRERSPGANPARVESNPLRPATLAAARTTALQHIDDLGEVGPRPEQEHEGSVRGPRPACPARSDRRSGGSRGPQGQRDRSRRRACLRRVLGGAERADRGTRHHGAGRRPRPSGGPRRPALVVRTRLRHPAASGRPGPGRGLGRQQRQPDRSGDAVRALERNGRGDSAHAGTELRIRTDREPRQARSAHHGGGSRVLAATGRYRGDRHRGARPRDRRPDRRRGECLGVGGRALERPAVAACDRRAHAHARRDPRRRAGRGPSALATRPTGRGLQRALVATGLRALLRLRGELRKLRRGLGVAVGGDRDAQVDLAERSRDPARRPSERQA